MLLRICAALIVALPLVAVEEGKPSATAILVSLYRAIGNKSADHAIRNNDHLAAKFLGPQELEILNRTPFITAAGATKLLAMSHEEAISTLDQRRILALSIGARTQFMDAAFESALQSGIRQIVILGAGLDSRAYRFAHRLKDTKIFEVDFPPTQEYKKRRVREVVGALPRHVTYVPIDFAKEELPKVLQAAGFDSRKKAFFLWEGVTYYIPAGAVDDTLSFIAGSAEGTTVAFDYTTKEALAATDEQAQFVRNSLKAMGEPWMFGLGEPAESFLRQRGLRLLKLMSVKDAVAPYIDRFGGPDTSLYYRSASFCTAVVPRRGK